MVRELARREGRARRVLSRGSLFACSLPSRVALGRRRLDLHHTIAALPAAPIETRTISVVIPDGADIDVSFGVNVERVTTAESASGSLVCFVAATSAPLEDHWLVRLANEVRDDVVAATPLLVRGEHLLSGTPADLRVEALGYDVLPGIHGAARLDARRAGTRPDARVPVEDVASASSACFLVARDALEAVGGLDSDLGGDAAIADLCVRLRTNGGRIVAVPSAVVADHRPVRAIAQLHDPFAMRSTEWSSVIARNGPALLHSASPSSPQRFAISTAAPSPKVAPRWGDWHFGDALARALRRNGFDVVLQTADESESDAGRSCDVHVVLHGLAPVRRAPGQRHVLWVISHPETLAIADVDAADLVFVASDRFASELRTLTSTPVETLLQATDQHRFRPMEADRRHAHRLVIVAKTRGVMRPAVADAIAAGLQPAIFGSGWRGLVDPKLIIADHVDNEELPLVYASAGVVLNDHWDSMRAKGFVSNRIFDVLACGTPVISDFLPEIAVLFAGTVGTYSEPAELRALVEDILSNREAARERARAGRDLILDAHTFDHRARTLVEVLERHNLLTAPFPDSRRVRRGLHS